MAAVAHLKMETESGVEFLSRVNTKPISSLGKEIFPLPLQPPQIIEVSGQTSTGKSLLCLDLMITILLPKKLFGVSLGGLESKVLFIDCDQHFNILHFADMIERKIKRICHEIRSEWKKLGSKICNEELMTIKKKEYNNKIHDALKNCLKNLIYFKCTDSNEFAITLLSLDQCLINNSDVSFVVIDSISAFYWYDRVYKADSWQRMESYLNNLFQNFISIIKKHYLVCICTRQDLFKKRKDKEDSEGASNILHHESSKIDESVAYEYLGKEWASNVTIKINTSLQQRKELVCENSTIKEYCIVIESLKEGLSKTKFCTFHEDGIRWLNSAENVTVN